jgi:hypothetical protein
MKKIFLDTFKFLSLVIIVLALFGLTVSANAQTALLHYQPGNRLIDGTQLNKMVDAVNNIQGNGTASAGTFTTLTASGNISLANGKLTTLASTGATGITGATTITTTSTLGLAVGRQGATDPVLRIDAGTSSVATGIRITGAAAAGGVAVAAISSGTDENLTINAKGAGTVTINGTATGNIVMGRAVTGVSTSVTGLVTSRSATATPAAASAVAGLSMGSSAIGIYWGTGDPATALTAAKGSVYIRTDGSSVSTRMYINTDGVTAWTAVTTAG